MPVVPLTPREANGVVAAIFEDVVTDGWRTIEERGNAGKERSDEFDACAACHQQRKSGMAVALNQFASVYQPNYLRKVLLEGLPGVTRCEAEYSPMTLTSVNEFLAELKTVNSQRGQDNSPTQPRLGWRIVLPPLRIYGF